MKVHFLMGSNSPVIFSNTVIFIKDLSLLLHNSKTGACLCLSLDVPSHLEVQKLVLSIECGGQ